MRKLSISKSHCTVSIKNRLSAVSHFDILLTNFKLRVSDISGAQFSKTIWIVWTNKISLFELVAGQNLNNHSIVGLTKKSLYFDTINYLASGFFF